MQPVQITQPPQQIANVIVTERPNDHMMFSILTCILCFCPTGLIAVIFSCFSKQASDRMDYGKAQSQASTAKIFASISLALGIIGIIAAIIYLVFVFVVFASVVSSITTSP